MPISVLIFLLSGSLLHSALSQDLEQIPSSEPLGVSGGLTTALITRLSESGTPHLSWVITASPSVSVYSFEFPFTIAFTDQDHRFAQPFNEYGMSPRYRWATFHGGYRSMSFSPFTLSGHQFLGGGVELTPGPVRVSGMYGRLVRAVVFDSIRDAGLPPAYERWGYAVKMGAGGPDNFVDLVYLSAGDQTESMGVPPWVSGITPANNVVTALITRQRFLQAFTVDLEAAASGYTRDRDAAPVTAADNIPEFLHSLLVINSSTRLSTAIRGAVKWNQSTTGIEVAYRRIDPGYQSMGAYYIQSDIEEITLGPSVRLFDSRIGLSGKIGLARDDLLRTKRNQTVRIVGSAQASLRPSPRAGLDLSYSNHSNARKTRVDSLADSLNLLTFVNSIGLVPTLTLGNAEPWQSTLSPSAFVQFFSSSGNSAQRTPDMVAQSYGFYYALIHAPTGLSLSPGISASLMQTGSLRTADAGGAFSVSRPFFDRKLTASTTAGFNARFEQSTYRSLSLPIGADAQYALTEKHRFSLRTNALPVVAGNGGSLPGKRTDFTVEITYGYTF